MMLFLFLFISLCMSVIIHYSVVLIYEVYYRITNYIYPFCRRGKKHEK